MVTSSLSSSDQCKQDLLIFNQLERLEAEQPEEAHEGARQGRGLVRGGQQRGEVSTVQYSTDTIMKVSRTQFHIERPWGQRLFSIVS